MIAFFGVIHRSPNFRSQQSPTQPSRRRPTCLHMSSHGSNSCRKIRCCAFFRVSACFCYEYDTLLASDLSVPSRSKNLLFLTGHEGFKFNYKTGDRNGPISPIGLLGGILTGGTSRYGHRGTRWPIGRIGKDVTCQVGIWYRS